jgi:Lon protease-like protein
MKSFLHGVTSSVRSSMPSMKIQSAEIPLFPLHSVLFPGGTMALKIFEQRYLELTKSCLKSGGPFGIALIREGDEVGVPAVPETVGTLAYVTHWDMQTLGILQVRVTGTGRFTTLSRAISKEGLILGQVSLLPDDTHVDCPEHIACAQFLRKVLDKVGAPRLASTEQFGHAAWVGYRLTELLPFTCAIKQKMLALTDARIRLEILYKFLLDQRLIE